MSKTTQFPCARCGVLTTRSASDVTRALKRGHKLYCGTLCSGHLHPLPASAIEGRRRGGRASGGSVEKMAASLRSSQGYRYVLLDERLREHSPLFEHVVGGFIFDLALPGLRLLFEFDEPWHNTPQHHLRDADKNQAGQAAGWTVCRLPADSKTVIDPAAVLQLLQVQK